jgi:heme-binding NEAT domain protein
MGLGIRTIKFQIKALLSKLSCKIHFVITPTPFEGKMIFYYL